MKYIVTALKWRPQTFEEVVGQEHISRTLKNAIQNNRIAHAYLFTGPRGVGKTTTARILAKTLNCSNPNNGNPCNKCAMCASFNNSQSLDVIEIDGASNRRIEEIRTLRESVKYAPTKGEYKVYIIDEVHMLTTESFNALLKTLEEPPDKTIFIFATTDIHKVPPTIISRCQRFDFRRIELNTIKNTLKKIADAEKIPIDDKSLTIIAKKADGALRDAEGLFDQVIAFCGNNINPKDVAMMLNLIDDEIYFSVSDAMLQKKFSEAFQISQTLYDNGWNFVDFLNGLIEHFRNIMTVIIRKNTDLVESAEIFYAKYLSYADEFSEADILRILNYLNRTQYELKSAQNHRLKIEVALCHLIGLEKTAVISEVLQKLSSDNNSSQKKKYADELDNSVKKNLSEGHKSELFQSEIKNMVLNEPNGNENINFITRNWIRFIDSVNSEKFTLGSHLLNSNPIEISDDKILVQLETKDDIDIISGNKSYLTCLQKKSEELFRRKFNFEFTSNPQITIEKKTLPIKTNNVISNIGEDFSDEENSIINAIINELGGKEVNK